MSGKHRELDHLYVCFEISDDYVDKHREAVLVNPSLMEFDRMTAQYGYTEFAAPQRVGGEYRRTPGGIMVTQYSTKADNGNERVHFEVLAAPIYEGKLDGE